MQQKFLLLYRSLKSFLSVAPYWPTVGAVSGTVFDTSQQKRDSPQATILSGCV